MVWISRAEYEMLIYYGIVKSVALMVNNESGIIFDIEANVSF